MKKSMGGGSSQEVLNQINLTQDICNKVVNYQETNLKYQTKSTTNISNTINNMMKTVQNTNTSSNVATDTVIQFGTTQENIMSGNVITIDGSSDVEFKQSNSLTQNLANYNNFTNKVWSESNVLMNVDAEIISDMMQQMSVENQATAQQTADNNLQNAVQSMNQAIAEAQKAEENESEGELNNAIDKISGIANNLIKSITGSKDDQKTTNIQNIKMSVQNYLESKNITNIEQIAEVIVNSSFVFNNSNTTENYQNLASKYVSHLSFLVSCKMTNDFSNNVITISNSTNISFDQSNLAKQELINTAISNIVTSNYFGNNSSVDVKSTSDIVTFLEGMNTTSTKQDAKATLSNDLSAVVDMSASASSTVVNKSTSFLGIIIGCVVALALIAGLVNVAITKITGKSGSERMAEASSTIMNSAANYGFMW